MKVFSKYLVSFALGLVALSSLPAAIGCSRFQDHPAPGPSSSAAAVERIPSYPRARWRLAPGAELARTVLWVSHIVVMHRDSAPAISGLRPLDWMPDSPPARSSEEALKIARDVAKRARDNPGKFAELVRESEDVVTRERGGSLGPQTASTLPAAFLDALAVLPPGAASDVITTPLGYHVILRRAAPPLDDVAGRRIVIRYATTFGNGPSTRSREAASALAHQIVAEARGGADFAGLVEKYSEGLDRDRGGDMGVNTTFEPGIHSPVVEALAQVSPGEVLPEPIETNWGFEIAKRVDVGPRTEFGARVVRITFDGAAPTAGADARKRALLLADAARRDPNAIARNASVEPIRWFDGRGDPVLTAIVEKLSLGAHTKAPVQLHDAFAVVERVEPNTFCAPPPFMFELPAPTWVDIEALIRVNGGDVLASAMTDLRRLVPALRLAPADARALTQALEGIHSDFATATTAEERVSAYRRSAGRLKKNLAEATYALVISEVQDWLGGRLVSPPDPLRTAG